ncbi:MAG: ribose 1,5-bisphosphate isomerase [Methanomicrobiales archaeon]|nr:ribose 1,5-bisphosphate isomerase [Methanomicrobiales archaeon]
MTLEETVVAIRGMEVRGAGRIARLAVEALCSHAAAQETYDLASFRCAMEQAARTLIATRPTAVSLPNAVHVVMAAMRRATTVPEAKTRIHDEGSAFLSASREAVKKIGEIGARHIRDGDVLLTHCNSEAALACIIAAHREGKRIEVYATEVRPRGQGLLTITALNAEGIRTNYIVDSAVRFFMQKVDLVVVGADAVAVNGAVVNKIGTSQIALTAHETRTSVMVAAETYKFAPRTIFGEQIAIEERDGEEVLAGEISRTLPHVTVRNPSFDVTPAEYIDLIVTEVGAIPPQMAYLVIRDHLGWEIGALSGKTWPPLVGCEGRSE